jgi:hypothetical protein
MGAEYLEIDEDCLAKRTRFPSASWAPEKWPKWQIRASSWPVSVQLFGFFGAQRGFPEAERIARTAKYCGCQFGIHNHMCMR